MSGIITGYGLFFIEKYFTHSVCHIVPPSNALLGRQNKEVVKVFLYFSRQCCACNIDYGRKRRTQCVPYSAIS